MNDDDLPCSIVHGKNNARNAAMIKAFRCGETRLMIAVNKLMIGFDVPEITDVFLARPCESDVLVAQMIGRGSRFIPNVKEEFYVHDFHDVIDSEKASSIFHGSDYLLNDLKREHFSPPKPSYVHLDTSFGSFTGLEFIDNQTFGVEIELTHPGSIPQFDSPLWKRGVNMLITCLNDALGQDVVFQEGLRYHGSQAAEATHLWRIESDSSAGWEIISPILIGTEGLQQLITACLALEKLMQENDIFHINFCCGLHLTLATNYCNSSLRQRAMSLISFLESGLFSLVSPSRLYKFNNRNSTYDLKQKNNYCSPICDKKTLAEVNDMALNAFNRSATEYRYYSVNFTKIKALPYLIEIRMHNSTVDPQKIIPWICLWMQIIKHGETYCSKEIHCSEIFAEQNDAESEDVLLLLNEADIVITDKLRNFIVNRRKQLAPKWKLANESKHTAWETAGWYL
jgi:hypothetical protein